MSMTSYSALELQVDPGPACGMTETDGTVRQRLKEERLRVFNAALDVKATLFRSFC